ncbi:divergent polysaccharide deacetylase family protein [Maricaulis sp.]|uniref:divergent polysaccharide deacetylase family protein n=1 Tax=Maricaulis sp. TaxID=1486257 RepID=UPI003A95667D
MRAKPAKPIRSHNASTPLLASLVVAVAYLLGATVFSIASAAPDDRPDRAIRFASAAVPAARPDVVPAPEPVLAVLPSAAVIETSATVPVMAQVQTPGSAAPRRPRIALIIDDVGLDEQAAARVLALDIPLTVAILPYADAAARTAQLAGASGRDVLVHVPMEPLGLADPGPHALRVDLSDADLRARIRWAMARVPGAVGLNNHMGSRFTQNPRALRVALGAIAERAPLFIDSMTTADSRGLAVAEGLGLEVLRRDVFLDHVIEAGMIAERLAEAQALALSQGHAVVIGHPHALTLDALEAWIGEAEAAGIEFVSVTTLSAGLRAEPAEQISASIAQ